MSSEEHLLCFISHVPACSCAEYSHCAMGPIRCLPERPALLIPAHRAAVAGGLHTARSVRGRGFTLRAGTGHSL